MGGFKLVKISAPGAFGRGAQYGEQSAGEIARCVDMYKEHLTLLRGITWDDARDAAMRYLPFVQNALPFETETLRGISAGSGACFEDVMVLNTRYEILHYPKNECTTYAVLPEASRGGKTYIGQNWDQRPMVMEHSIILHATLGDGCKIMGLTEAGQLLRNGFNSRGLGLVASGLNSTLDGDGPGIPGNFMRLRALRSSTFDEMADFTASVHRGVANNYCVASAEGRAEDIECVPGRPRRFAPEMGVITHANHLLVDKELDSSKGTKFRGERLGELLRVKAPGITADDLKECLADHSGFPDSVCSHTHDGAEDMRRQWMTVASVIYNLSDLEMELCVGNPCKGAYVKYRLNDY
jgi:isopenicillin-N N-acyltransferase-like protein